jgi:hypothetical protein
MAHVVATNSGNEVCRASPGGGEAGIQLVPGKTFWMCRASGQAMGIWMSEKSSKQHGG